MQAWIIWTLVGLMSLFYAILFVRSISLVITILLAAFANVWGVALIIRLAPQDQELKGETQK